MNKYPNRMKSISYRQRISRNTKNGPERVELKETVPKGRIGVEEVVYTVVFEAVLRPIDELERPDLTVLVASDVVAVTVIACVVVDVRRQIAAAHLVVREDMVHYELKRCAQILERTKDQS